MILTVSFTCLSRTIFIHHTAFSIVTSSTKSGKGIVDGCPARLLHSWHNWDMARLNKSTEIFASDNLQSISSTSGFPFWPRILTHLSYRALGKINSGGQNGFSRRSILYTTPRRSWYVSFSRWKNSTQNHYPSNYTNFWVKKMIMQAAYMLACKHHV